MGPQGEAPELDAALRAVAGRLAGMARNEALLSTPIVDWSVYRHLQHVALGQETLAKWVCGEDAPHPGADEVLDAEPVLSGEGMARRLVNATEAFIDARRRNQGTLRPNVAVGGAPMSMLEWGGFSLTHLLMHAEALARALAEPPVLVAEHLRLALPFIAAAMPVVRNAEIARKLEGRIRVDVGRSVPSFAIRVSHGDVTVEHTPEDEQADCVITASPEAFLEVTIGLRRQADAIEQGRFSVAGPKPELGAAYRALIGGSD